MSALFRIVYAAHANGTHHKLALDALNHLQRGDAEQWRRVFLKHIDKYLEGSKAPDNVFKDFKNHVLHVGENYWGGAPEKVEEWYGKTVDALRAGQWADAAYAAGVLSHYYTDPVMPFHTGQTEAESAIHRATEWSINRSYNKLRKLGEERFPGIEAKTRNSAGWVKEMTCDGAEYSHRYYEKLIAHYDIHRGVVVPEEGLDSISQPIVAELLMYAADGFGLMLDRAIAESAVTAPDVTLTLETFLAALQIPSKWIEKKLTNAEDKKLVQAMYDELKATGRVDATLPEDDRTIRDLHAAQVLAPKLAKRQEKRAARLPASHAPAVEMSAFERALSETAGTIATKLAGPAQQPRAVPAHALAPAIEKQLPPAAVLAPELPDAPPAPVAIEEKPLSLPPRGTFAAPRFDTGVEPLRSPAPVAEVVAEAPDVEVTDVEVTAVEIPADEVPAFELPAIEPNVAEIPAIAAAAPVTPIVTAARKPAVETRTYLAVGDPLEGAPSIGPKMAERFAGLGIHTVSDFLGHDPHDMAELLDDNRIDAETLIDWQDQAQLVIEIPGLRGGGAQLLVGAGYRTTEAIADADPVDLSADVLTFATSSDGRRILRDGTPPDIEKIKDWVSSARLALAA